MSNFPKQVTRVTKHKKPRYQLYQPGFNRFNSCWLPGEWVTVPEKEWKAKRASHTKMYKGVSAKSNNQHYRNKGTALKRLAQAEKQAYEFNSGSMTFDAIVNNGENEFNRVSPIGVRMQGNRVRPEDAKSMLERGYRILRKVKKPNGKVVNQTRGVKIPADFISDAEAEDGDPVNFWAEVVKQNKAKEIGMFNSCLGALKDTTVPEQERGFAAMMAFQQLIMSEENIIREEYNRTKGKVDDLMDLDEEHKTYVKMRAELEKFEGFEDLYQRALAGHNECARHNLDNSKGLLYSYVLPKFHSNGTHEPWGERDVPWGQ